MWKCRPILRVAHLSLGCCLVLLTLPSLPPIHRLSLLVGASSLFAAPVDPDNPEEPEEKDEGDRSPGTTRPDAGKNPKVDPAKRGEALEHLRRRIEFSSSTDRRNAIRDVKRLQAEEKAPFFKLLSLLAKTDTDMAVREAAMRLLAEEGVETAECKEAFLAGLDDVDRNVQIEALKGIRKISLKQADEKLARFVMQAEFKKNDAVVHTAIRTLGHLGYQSPELIERFLAALDDSGTEIESRRAILLYAGSVRAGAMRERLLKTLGSSTDDLVMRSYSANALGKMAAKEGGTATGEEREGIRKGLLAALEEVRNIRDVRERTRFSILKQQCILGLIRMGDDSMKGELRSGAQDDDAGVRLRSIRYMGELKLTEYRDLISYMAKHDENPRVRKEAERVLKGMGN